MSKLLNKKSIYIKIPHNEKINIHNIILKKQSKKINNKPDFNLEVYNIVNKYKSYISNYSDWDKYKGFTNLLPQKRILK